MIISTVQKSASRNQRADFRSPCFYRIYTSRVHADDHSMQSSLMNKILPASGSLQIVGTWAGCIGWTHILDAAATRTVLVRRAWHGCGTRGAEETRLCCTVCDLCCSCWRLRIVRARKRPGRLCWAVAARSAKSCRVAALKV